jgi:NAD(P)-dependent dehydrogenase (short-subunit alcohol dehydrogenase family)
MTNRLSLMMFNVLAYKHQYRGLSMKEFENKIAVITGAASGIGKALAEHCISKRMKVVLADIEEGALAQTVQELNKVGGTILSVKTDVSQENDIKLLAEKVIDHFGSVHLLFNNAGVGIDKEVLESTVADWKWLLGVNLWSMIYSIRNFVPMMLRQDTECHIINTASIAGLISGPGMGVYKVTKYGIISVSETLYHELVQMGSKIKVSVLCPGSVNTRIIESSRNRPVELRNAPCDDRPESPQAIRDVKMGLSPKHIAEITFQGIISEKFYIFTHPETRQLIQERMESIMQDLNSL